MGLFREMGHAGEKELNGRCLEFLMAAAADSWADLEGRRFRYSEQTMRF
jgi:hypothetical protein